jgi:UDP-glucose 4-epimerase
MRVLVTGGAGFIGSHLVDALIDLDSEVVVLDNLATGYADNVHRQARLVVGDVAEPDVVAAAMAGVEVVFHLAAARAVVRSVQLPLATDRANTRGTLSVLEAARHGGTRRVICTSSSSVYGGAALKPTPETAPLVPRSPYAVSKLAAEHYARVYWELYRLETVSIRLFNVYGPRQRADNQYAAVIPLFIDALRTGVAPRVHGDGRQSRDFTFVDDAVSAILAAAEAPGIKCAGRVYNAAGGSEHSLLDLLAALERVLEVRILPVHVEPRAGDVRHSRADVSAAREDLGWAPQVGFEEGLARTVAWFATRSPPGCAR